MFNPIKKFRELHLTIFNLVRLLWLIHLDLEANTNAVKALSFAVEQTKRPSLTKSHSQVIQ